MSIAKALVAAQSAAQAVAKGSTNNFHKYKYASAEAVIEEARVALNQAGLAVITMGWSTSPSSEQSDSRVTVQYRVVHEAGESLDMTTSTPVIPDKGRPGDKAEMAALTMNLSYFLRGLLLLPREDESSAIDQRDDRNYTPRNQRAQPVIAGAVSNDYSAAKAAMDNATDAESLKAVATMIQAAKSRMTEGEVASLKASYAARKAEVA